MKRNMKALGLGLFAMLAVGAVAMSNAVAETGGTFDTGSTHTIITATEESEPNRLELQVAGLENGIVCDEATYEGTASAESVSSLTITPEYAGCKTTGQTAGSTVVDRNGCNYVFTIGKNAAGDNTADLECPEGNSIVVTHPSCTITIPPKNGLSGVSYTNLPNGTVTVNSTVSGFDAYFHGGICQLLGTKHKGELNGSAIASGVDTNEKAVTLKATGSED